MFDKEKVKEILSKVLLYDDIDWDKVLSDYEVKDGFIIFKYNYDAFFFIGNTLIDSCPGYYNIEEKV